MNAKKAKKIRKAVYGDFAIKDQYGIDQHGARRCTGRRGVYKTAKKGKKV